MKEFELGPFNYTVGDPLALRKGTFECMYTINGLLCIDSMDNVPQLQIHSRQYERVQEYYQLFMKPPKYDQIRQQDKVHEDQTQKELNQQLDQDLKQRPTQSFINNKTLHLLKNVELICEICSSMVNVTFNHGAKTCEACKKFFVRSLKRNITECKYKNECTITENGRRCESCRLNKCAAIGMKHYKTAIGKNYFPEKKNVCLNAF